MLIYPRSVAVAVVAEVADLPNAVRMALQQANVAVQSLACVVAADSEMASTCLREAALELGVPLRFVAAPNDVAALAQTAVPQAIQVVHELVDRVLRHRAVVWQSSALAPALPN